MNNHFKFSVKALLLGILVFYKDQDITEKILDWNKDRFKHMDRHLLFKMPQNEVNNNIELPSIIEPSLLYHKTNQTKFDLDIFSIGFNQVIVGREVVKPYDFYFNKETHQMLIKYVDESNKIGELPIEDLFVLFSDMELIPEFIPLNGEERLYTLSVFDEEKESGAFTPNTGSGYYVANNLRSNISCFDKCPEWANYVVWYNK